MGDAVYRLIVVAVVCVACLSGEVLARIPVEMTYSLAAQDDSLAVRCCNL